MRLGWPHASTLTGRRGKPGFCSVGTSSATITGNRIITAAPSPRVLSLVRSLTELHGGRMTIDSTLGEGAAVMIRLPVMVAAGSLDPQPSEATPATVEA